MRRVEAPPSGASLPWRRWAVWAVSAGLAGYAVWVWLVSDALDVIRVGPRPSAGHPVVVFLHGHGAAGDDLEPLAESLSKSLPETTFLLPEGPHSVALAGRSWIPSFEAPSRAEYVARLDQEVAHTREQLWRVVESARSRGVSCSDITIAGFSLGARMAVEVALLAPLDCALGGLIVLSGVDNKEHPLPSGGGAAFPALVAHGTQDEVVPLRDGVAIKEHLERAGHPVTWLSFNGPHTIAPEVEAAVLAFLRGPRTR